MQAFQQGAFAKSILSPSHFLLLPRPVGMMVAAVAALAASIYAVAGADASAMLWSAPILAIALVETWMAGGKFAVWFAQELQGNATAQNSL